MAVAVIIDVLRALASPFTMRLWTDGVSVPINHAGAYELAELASEMGFISVGDPSSNLWAHLSGTPTLGITKVSSDAPNADVVVEFGPAPRLPVFAASGVVRI
uniref:Uncharacterized protein n=1 Tax=Spongospora subterranea TaxID=70186 RepID=A0A0H5RBN6_9EUKA|eukprot:CRZ05874.1 hypothetical protein [Spongospora subterranea]